MSLNWRALINRSVNGKGITREEARSILNLPDGQILEVLKAAFEVRRAFFGKRVKLCVLQNACSGMCGEDCRYCSQSSVSTAKIQKYPLMDRGLLLEGAKRACKAGGKRYCMVASGRGPSDKDVEHFCEVTKAIKTEFPLEICVSLGIISEEQARKLKAAGVGWVNHNLNTSERFHPEVCTTHTYEDRIKTVENIRTAGLNTCSGGIIGMGETDEDIVDLAFTLRKMRANCVPVNFLHPIPGTPMESFQFLTPAKSIKALCLFRFVNPTSEIRAAGGREVNLGSLQSLVLYPVDSIFVQGYLTTPGQSAEEARRMIEEMDFEVEEREVQKLAV